MNTMLVMCRASPLGARAGAKLAMRQPDLPDDFRDAQVAVEALLRGRAEGAVHGAAHLAGDAQRAAIGLGDVDRLDALHLVHAQHPLARAVRRDLFGDDFRNGDLAPLRASCARKSCARSVIAEKSAAPRR